MAGVTNVVLTTRRAEIQAATLMARSSRCAGLRACRVVRDRAAGADAEGRQAGVAELAARSRATVPASTSDWLPAGISTPSKPYDLTSFR